MGARTLDRDEARRERDAHVGRLREPLRRLGKLGNDPQRLLKERGRLAAGGAGDRLVRGLVQILHPVALHLASQGVMRELLDVLAETVGVQVLDGADDGPVQRLPALAQEPAVGDVVRQRVLERVLELGKQSRLVQELTGLEASEAAAAGFLVEAGHREQERERHVASDDRRRLQQALVVSGEPIDARREDRLHRRRHPYGVEIFQEAVGAAGTAEHTGLDEGLHAFLEKERVAFRSLDQQVAKLQHARIVAQEAGQQLLGAPGPERVDPDLAIVRLAAPRVLVFGTVIDREEQAGRRKALDQGVEERLGLGVDPLKILEHEQQRARLALAQEDPLDGGEGPAAALGRRKPEEGALLGQGIEEPEDRRDCLLEALVERQEVARDLRSDGADVVGRLDPKVGTEQIDHWQVRRPLAVGDGAALEREPAARVVRVNELVEQA